MPPQIALLICFVFIAYIYHFELKKRQSLSFGLWIPQIWFTILMSRTLDQWLGVGRTDRFTVADVEGTYFDRIVFTLLIAGGLLILIGRKINWASFIRSNKWIIIWFIYCGISIIWSDFPEVALIRWYKSLGVLIMVLIVLTDKEPFEAVKAIIRRGSYLLIPLSIVFIKYYPEIGVYYSPWGGREYIGVTLGKNSLGRLCAVSGFYYFFAIASTWRNKEIIPQKKELVIHWVLLLMTLWLLIKSDSKTALGIVFVGVFIFFLMGLQILKRNIKSLGLIFIVLGLITGILLQSGLLEVLVGSLGRDMTLTGRTDVWKDTLALVNNPLIGVGYDSFWLGERLNTLWDKYWWQPNEAHNGYLEVYLELGILGLILFAGLIVSTFRKIQASMKRDVVFGRVRIAFLMMFVIWNITESAVKGVSIMWFVFLLIAVQIHQKIEHMPHCLYQRSNEKDV